MKLSRMKVLANFDGKGVGWFAPILFFLISSVILSGGMHFFLLQKGEFFMVKLNDMEIGLLAGEDDLAEILDTLEKEAANYYGRPVKVNEEVTATKVFLPLAEEEPEKVYAQLRNMLSYKVAARMVTVNGKDVLPLSSDADVDLLYEMVASAFIPQKENVLLENIQLSEKISTREYYCSPEDICDVETLAAVLLRGTDRREVYLVSRGDSLWKIAQENSLSVDELKEANPQIDGEKLQIGDEINLIVPEPMVNVTTVERLTVEEKIPFETNYTYDSTLWKMQSQVIEEGKHGVKEVEYQITRENGKEISREIIKERVIEEPKPQLVAKGIAEIPSKETGSFIWPVQGGGRITSGYGWRSGGFHAGIDIGARSGTPVLAADSGVVVFEGWDGGYGKSIVIFHGHYYTRYAHNSQNKVTVGQAVNKGQVIASVGITGRATGYHLHFEVRTGGIYGNTLNPLNFFSP
ncbi:MAG: M23 family metallopeptidase [Firmicutes bacterium]|nr:M23 family metallopeptidase [Bacillota bacterium]